jgi:hypothetical protein
MVAAFIMYRLLALLLIVSCARPAPPQASDLRAWAGEYEYSEAEPPDLIMDYLAKISADGRVRVTVDGHMTTIHLLATARPEGDHVLGIFYDRTLDYEWPKLGLKRGDRIVTLQKKGERYFMRWGGLTSQLDRPQAQVEIVKRK